jgi:hypothetical protein
MASLLDLVQARQGLLGVQRPSMTGLLGGAQPTGTLASTIQGYQPPRMTAMSNQAVMDYARNVASTAQQNLQNQMTDLDRALVMDQGGINVGDRQALARLMEQIPGLMGATAYHGTPHTIRGKFDISKVGTGEGAQSYGHGIYFAENPAVAKGYADKLGYDYQYAGKTPKEGSPTDFAIRWLKNLGWDKEAAKAQWKNEGFGAKVIEAIDKVDLEKVKAPGNFYKVDIPDEYIPNMLDWDKPFSKQTEQVKEAIKKIEPKIKQINPDINVEKLTGEQIYRAYQQYRGNQPDFASEGLNELGIKGIRYLDQGSRNPGFSSLTPTQLQARIESLQESINSGFGNTQVLKDKLKSLQNEMDSYKNMTSNFVVFDPTDVKILEKNSQKVEGLLD